MNATTEQAERGYMSVEEVARYLDMSVSTVYKLTSDGTLPHYKPKGKKLYFKRSELDSWVMRGKEA